MRNRLRPREIIAILAGVGGVLYPFIVYFGLPHLRPGLLVGIALALGAIHLLNNGRTGIMPRWNWLAIPGALAALSALRPALAAQAYPLLVSLSLALTFGWSLMRPPTAIERIARLTAPDLPSEAVAYTRTVTKVWTAFFVANAAITGALSLWAPVVAWTVWTGLISYLLIGALFGGEMIVRRRAMQRVAP